MCRAKVKRTKVINSQTDWQAKQREQLKAALGTDRCLYTTLTSPEFSPSCCNRHRLWIDCSSVWSRTTPTHMAKRRTEDAEGRKREFWTSHLFGLISRKEWKGDLLQWQRTKGGCSCASLRGWLSRSSLQWHTEGRRGDGEADWRLDSKSWLCLTVYSVCVCACAFLSKLIPWMSSLQNKRAPEPHACLSTHL